MKTQFIIVITALVLFSCNTKDKRITEMASPNEKVVVDFNINKECLKGYCDHCDIKQFANLLVCLSWPLCGRLSCCSEIKRLKIVVSCRYE